MNPVDHVILALLLLILGGAACYILRAKRKGVKCIGCPHGGNCRNCPGSRKGSTRPPTTGSEGKM